VFFVLFVGPRPGGRAFLFINHNTLFRAPGETLAKTTPLTVIPARIRRPRSARLATATTPTYGRIPVIMTYSQTTLRPFVVITINVSHMKAHFCVTAVVDNFIATSQTIKSFYCLARQSSGNRRSFSFFKFFPQSHEGRRHPQGINKQSGPPLDWNCLIQANQINEQINKVNSPESSAIFD
jgi:hypothetical protein